MLTIRHAGYLMTRTLSLFRLARGPDELGSVLLFTLKYLAWPLLPAGRRSVDTRLRLGGIDYTIGVRGRESFVFHELYIDGIYERDPSFVPQPGWIVVDVGANAGVFAVQQARRGARVFAFEPNADAFRRLMETRSRNHLEACLTATNAAVGARSGRAALVVGGSTLGGHLASAELAPEAAPKVDVRTLDHLLGGLGLERIDLLKIDVEGSEADVLDGAPVVLQRVRRLVLEYHSDALLRGVDDRLRNLGFRQVLRDETSPAEHRGNVYFERGPGPDDPVERDQSTFARSASAL